MYVRIIDRGECMSTTSLAINGIPANRNEWAKYNFYPQNGMVGEVVRSSYGTYIIKFGEGIFVPMTQQGVVEITRSEYENAKRNEKPYSGMDERQKNINASYDDFMAGLSTSDFMDMLIPDLPDLRQSFKNDTIQFMKKLTCDYERNIFLSDLEDSCVMYAVDMAIEYIDKSDLSPIPNKILNQICEQVTDVYIDLFKVDFHEESKKRCINRIKMLMQDPNATRATKDAYYKRVNERYARH